GAPRSARPRTPPPPRLFPYTTLFRSSSGLLGPGAAAAPGAGRRRANPSTSVPSGELHPAHHEGRHLVALDVGVRAEGAVVPAAADRKSTRLNSSHVSISYAVFCLKKK